MLPSLFDAAASATTLSGARAASPVMDVLERVAPVGLSTWRPRARLANTYDQHLCVQRLEPMQLFEVRLELGDHRLFDVEHSAAQLADGVMVVA